MAEIRSDFFSSFAQAQEAYQKWKSKDPFSSIPPALLNSADVEDYIRLTGMIYPFHKSDLVGATYSVRLKGLCVYYKEQPEVNKPEKRIFCIGKDAEDLPNTIDNGNYTLEDKLILEPNSITFVTLEPVFQVPDYLALRFNLKISHVYKGLLLGTGPIIDPGFQGRLSIPLHNLTSNRYVFFENDEIISLEFTKMSPYPLLKNCNFPRYGKYTPTSIKPHRQVIEYLDKALGQLSSDGIVSSLIAATADIRTTANNATSSAKSAVDTATATDKKINRWGIIGTIVALFAIFIAAFGLLLPTFQLVVSVRDTQSGYETQIADLEEEVADLKQQLEDLIAESNQTLTPQQNQIETTQQGQPEATPQSEQEVN